MAGKCLRSSIPIYNQASKSSASRYIEFYDYDGPKKSPTVLYVPGFGAAGHGTKSQELIKHFQAKGQRYICYDPESRGESPPKLEDISTLEFKHWFEDAETAIKAAKSDSVILCGSSMGGWISLKMANMYPDLIKGLVLIAPAVNFLRKKYQTWYDQAAPEIQKEQDDGKVTIVDSGPFGTLFFMKEFAAKSEELEFDLSKPNTLQIQCPVKIIHGVQDDTVPYKQSLQVMEMISTSNVELIYQKSGDHRMQNTEGIDLITRELDDLIAKVK